ncbi:MAG: hypothetical protein KJ556_21085 [Gammaproteobacteria bacterium]|nr:hypothetical protein [Gammaproteobacteria bacterium]
MVNFQNSINNGKKMINESMDVLREKVKRKNILLIGFYKDVWVDKFVSELFREEEIKNVLLSCDAEELVEAVSYTVKETMKKILEGLKNQIINDKV